MTQHKWLSEYQGSIGTFVNITDDSEFNEEFDLGTQRIVFYLIYIIHFQQYARFIKLNYISQQ